MRMKLKILGIFLTGLLLVGCGKTQNNPYLYATTPDGRYCEYNDATESYEEQNIRRYCNSQYNDPIERNKCLAGELGEIGFFTRGTNAQFNGCGSANRLANTSGFYPPTRTRCRVGRVLSVFYAQVCVDTPGDENLGYTYGSNHGSRCNLNRTTPNCNCVPAYQVRRKYPSSHPFPWIDSREQSNVNGICVSFSGGRYSGRRYQ